MAKKSATTPSDLTTPPVVDPNITAPVSTEADLAAIAKAELAAEIAQEEADRIEKIVNERVAAILSQRAEEARMLKASDYLPLRAVTRVPLPGKTEPENDPNAWESVSAEDFSEDHAQRLIDHFTRLEGKFKHFNAVNAINDQLGKRA